MKQHEKTSEKKSSWPSIWKRCWEQFTYQPPINSLSLYNTVKYLVSAHPPLKHKFLRKVGGGRLLGILPFVQSVIQPLKVQFNTKKLEFKQKSIHSNFKMKGKRKLVIFKHTHPVYLSQSKTGHIATENHSHNFRFPLALLLRFIVSFSSSLK